MQKTILITGSTDGIGLETAKMLSAAGHRVLLHGRSEAKLDKAKDAAASDDGFLADLSVLAEVDALARAVASRYETLDALINNAGVYVTRQPVTVDGLDARFAVNTVAPFLLTDRLMPTLGAAGRVVNVSSAAQAPVKRDALVGRVRLADGAAYAQSKLALTMWTNALACSLDGNGPSVFSVNPGSLLGSNMVRDAFGIAGGDLRIGADILCRAAVSEEFDDANGKYFDNDSGQFASPHGDALDSWKAEEVLRAVREVLSDRGL